jgi:hypothetical protein
MKSFKNAKRVLALKLVHRAKAIQNMKLAFDLKLLKKAIRLLKEKQRRLVRRTGVRLLLRTQKQVRFERKWKRILTLEAEMRRRRGLPTLEDEARTLAGLPIMDAIAHMEEPSPELLAWPSAYRDVRGYEPVTDAQREANRSGWAFDDRTRRGGGCQPFPADSECRRKQAAAVRGRQL